MPATIVERNDRSFTVQVTIPYVETMLEFEEAIQSCVNELGQAATQEALGRFDTDGAPLEFGGTRFFSKGAEPKEYQTPYGPVSMNRQVYQTAQGGKTFCPLEHGARIIITSTPKFAKMVSSKYADLGGSRVQADLRDNHGRPVARSFIQNVSEAVSAVLEAKADQWHYQVPQTDKAIHSVAIGLDGTTLLLCEQGYREAMVGTVALYDKEGERQHTIYLAASPEYGKATFLGQLEQEIGQIKQTYPQAQYVGIADGARCNWAFLVKHTDSQTIDFWHAAEYLGKAAGVMFPGPRRAQDKAQWLEQACHKLKHQVGGATRLCKEMKAFRETRSLSESDQTNLETAITYFGNNKGKMTYAKNANAVRP